MNGLNNIIKETIEQISELEDSTIEITYSGQHRENRLTESNNRASGTWRNNG